MERIQLIATAKINLSLRILGKRQDGFHEIETLMVPINLADEVEIMHGNGQEIQFTCNDPDLPTGSENLCVKAAEAFRKASGLEHGVTISLMKRIPHGAGLGGGSSDAAAVLLGLNELFDDPLVPEELHQTAASLGSDVPFFLTKGPAWCRGRGEILEPHPSLPERRILLVKPPFPVSTAWAYKRYAEMKQLASKADDQGGQLGDADLVNDLEEAVFDKYILLPVMKQWLRQQSGVESALMTGSGSTIVAVMTPDATGDSMEKLKKEFTVSFGPTFWMCESRFLGV